MSVNYTGYEALLEMKGWTYLRDNRGAAEDYMFMVHDACLIGTGVEWISSSDDCDAPAVSPVPAVMHWKEHTCQACGLTPPDELLALYLLHEMENPKKLNQWDQPVMV